MSYIDGFLVAVPTANKHDYLEYSTKALPVFKDCRAQRNVEGWGDDVPKGKLNDLQGAVKASEEETVLFGWVEYPDKRTRDAAWVTMTSDPRMQDMGEMPFDGQRMVYGGFAPIVDAGSGRGSYIDGFVVPVPQANRNAYQTLTQATAPVFLEYGATRVVEAWGEDVPNGKHTDFRRAVLVEADEQVVFGWIEWPSKQVRDAAWPKLMEDERMQQTPEQRPYDGKRMIYGGFVPILDA